MHENGGASNFICKNNWGNKYRGNFGLYTNKYVIAGSGRSGTTWILDALASANALRTIFEPLHPQAIPKARPFANAYVAKGAEYRDLRNYLDSIFTGNIKSIWANYRVRPDRLMPRFSNVGDLKELKSYVRRYINLWNNYRQYGVNKGQKGLMIKFIRANLMLGWLEANYDIKILFVVRHPGAVVASQLEKGEEWDASALTQFTKNMLLWRDHLGKHEKFLSKNLTRLELYTTIWCIQNAFSIQESIDSGRPITYYERLITESENEWARITHALRLSNIPESAVISAPSQQSSNISARDLEDNTIRVSRWTQGLSKQDLANMQRVLDEFGVSVYSAHDVIPIS